MLAVQIHAPPLRSLVGSPLQELARRITKKLGYIHLFRSSSFGHRPARRRTQRRFRGVVEETGEEVVKQAPAASKRRTPAPRLRRVELAEVLDPRWLPRSHAPYRGDRRSHPAYVAESSLGHFPTSSVKFVPLSHGSSRGFVPCDHARGLRVPGGQATRPLPTASVIDNLSYLSAQFVLRSSGLPVPSLLRGSSSSPRIASLALSSSPLSPASTGMRLGSLAAADPSMVTSRTPFSYRAWILSSSTPSGNVMLRRNEPRLR